MNTKKKDELSSSKCDFKFSFGDLNFEGKKINQDYQWNSAAPGEKIHVQSSKCDWKITAAGEKVFTALEKTDLSAYLSGQFGKFNGLVGSDKCDYHITVKNPGVAFRVDSDKCDWRVINRSDIFSFRSIQGPGFFDFKSQSKNDVTRLNSDKCDYRLDVRREKARFLLDSDKCDWKISATDSFKKGSAQLNSGGFDLKGSIGNFSANVSSSKCDWRVLYSDRETIFSALSSDQNFSIKSKIRGLNSAVSSDKCDFRVTSGTDVILPLEVNTQSPRVKMNMSSSKCDWRLRAINESDLFKKTPVFGAMLSSSKCDFTLNIEFGLRGGKYIHISAVSSSKCDFKIKDKRGWVEEE